MLAKTTAVLAAVRLLVWQRHKFLTVVTSLILVVAAVSGGLILHLQQTAAKHPAASHQSGPPAVAVIEITASGFVPGTLSVNANTNVVWVNEDVMPHLPAADPYPSHSSLPDLVAPRALGIKETYTFHVSHAETINYHDDLNPVDVGTVVVR